MEGFRVQPADCVNLMMSVSSLFTVSGGWDEEKLRRLFTLREVDAILNIPVVQTDVSDVMIWHYNRHGKYSVKSGFWVERNGRRLESEVADLNADVTQYWRHLWKP